MHLDTRLVRRHSPPDFERFPVGIWLPDPERESLESVMLQRGVLLAVSRAVGSPNDPAKAQPVFQTTDVKVPHEAFVFQMAS